MSENNGIFAVVRSVASTVNTICELDDFIKAEWNELRINELRKRREHLMEVLKQLTLKLEHTVFVN